MNKIVGIDIGGTYIKAGIVINPPEVQNFNSIPTQPGKLIDQLIEIIKQLRPYAVGIGAPGLISNGIIHHSPNLFGVKNLNLKEALQAELKIPVEVENDANVVALSEWQYGAGKGVHNLLLLTLGTGVGGGLILNDKLYTGTGFAGEVGHITIDPNGPPCGCGNYGCLESYVGSEYLERRAIQGIRTGIKTSLSRYKKITPEIISQQAYKGDEFARSIIETAGYYLGIGIANLWNIFSPERVVIGGGIARAGQILFDKIRKEASFRVYQRKGIEIVSTQLADFAGILGAAYYALQSLF